MKKKFCTIYVDDVRVPVNPNCIVVRTYAEAIAAILERVSEYDIVLDLDHDLGEEHSGYDICKFVVENHIPLYGYRVHSMNPVGTANMIQLLDHYGYHFL